MAPTDFQVKNSVTRRLKAIMVAIAVFFLLSAGGIYLSSLSFLDGLQRINSANLMLNLIAQSIEALDTSNQNLEKLPITKNLNDIRFSFNESQKMLKAIIREAIEASSESPQVKKHLTQSLDSVYLYEESVNKLFDLFLSLPKSKTDSHAEDLNTEIVTANQFAIDSRENLRKAQIELRRNSDRLFTSLYEDRFWPLIVTMTLSAIFFLFVITFGFSISKRIRESLGNLQEATIKVSKGNLSYEAPILNEDEFGFVTLTFNDMVHSLEEGRKELDLTIKRIQRLQYITTKFSEALNLDEVVDVTVSEGFEVMNIKYGAVALLSADGTEIEVKRFQGYTADVEKRWQKFSVSMKTPLADAIRQKSPLYIETGVSESYPHMSHLVEYGIVSFAVIPLRISESIIGALGFGFDTQQSFDESSRSFMEAMARQCSQAIHRSKLFEENRKAIQLRDDFLSIASHELKTPLTPLKLQLQMIGRQIEKKAQLDSDKLSQFMSSSDRSVNRLSKLIDDLLDVSRISSGKFNLKMEKVNYSRLILDVISQYERQLKESIPEIIVDADPDIEGVCDQVRIEQVLINLLTNAAKYAPGKPVKLTLKRKGNYVCISVKDQGPGIAREHQERIFERFERVKSSENITGLGLGLFISHQIVLAHKGIIQIESEPGQGAEFKIELPLSV